MGNLLGDSFQHYDDTHITDKWTAHEDYHIESGGGPRGENCMLGDSQSDYLFWTFGVESTLTLGFRFKYNNLPGSTSPIIYFRDNTTKQVGLFLRADGFFEARTGTLTILGTSTHAFAGGEWYFIEMQSVIHNSTGTFVLRIDEVTEINLSGIDTQAGASAQATNIYFDDWGKFGEGRMVDLYLRDDATFLGDGRMECLFPDGAGTYSAWTPSAGSNYENVDEATPDDNSTYNETDTATSKDSYTFDDLATTSGDVKFVQWLALLRKTDAGSRTVVPLVRTGGADYVGSNKNPGLTYRYHLYLWETNPDTSSDWTISEVNSAEFGARLDV